MILEYFKIHKDAAMIKMSEYAKRRKELMQGVVKMGVIPSAPEVYRNGDAVQLSANSDFII